MTQISKLEKETNINYNYEEEFAEVFTHDKRLINYLKKSLKDNVEHLELVNEDNINGCCKFNVPKSWIKVRKPKEISNDHKNKLLNK